MMFRYSLVLLCLCISVALPASQLKSDNCQRDNVLITYEDSLDYTHACQAIETIINIFQKYHFETSEIIKITFQEKVVIEIKSADEQMTVDEMQVYALYDSTINEMFVSKFNTPYIQSRKAFDFLQVTPSMHESIIVHELAHRFLHLYYRDVLNQKNPDHATHEFFAYYIQINTLDNSDQNLVLALWPESEFTTDLSINSLVHGTHPHKFGVMSFRYAVNSDVITQILEGSFYSGDKILENFI